MNDTSALLGGLVRLILILCGGALLLYAAYVLYFYTAQRTMLFPRHFIPSAPAVFPAHNALDVSVETAAGRVEAWLLWPQSESAVEGLSLSAPYPLLVVGHGNGEIIDYWVDAVAPLRAREMAVLLVEFPGYGRSAGYPSEAAIVEVFLGAYDTAVAHPEIDAEQVWLFGRSVGGGAVAQVAARRPSAGLILFSTFTSVRAMAGSYRLPGFLARDPFDTLAVVRDYSGPLLILHGERDTIIPFDHARQLHAAAPHAELRALPCGHNDCVRNWQGFWDSLADFLVQ